ncbi:MAG: hypothetical protein IKZ46_01280 [Victivallales bacterium]|nr:hypothetical protein [Victivallales bacterium]
MKLPSILLLIPALLFSEVWQYDIDRLGDAKSAELSLPGADGTDAAMLLTYEKGPWSRFNWPRFKPVSDTTSLQFKIRRPKGDLPDRVQIRVQTNDGIEWHTKSPRPITAEWTSITLTPNDFQYFRSGNPDKLPELSFGNAIQFQILPSSNAKGGGAFLVDDVRFLPNGPIFTHDKAEWKVPKDAVTIEYERLADLWNRLNVELNRLDANKRQIQRWITALEEVKKLWAEDKAKALELINAPDRPWLESITAASVKNMPSTVTFPTKEEFQQELSKLGDNKPLMITDFPADIPLGTRILYSAVEQDAPQKLTENGVTFVRQHVVFTNLQEDQTVFLRVLIPATAFNNGDSLNLENLVVKTKIRCNAKGLNEKLPLMLRLVSKHPENLESFIDIDAVPAPTAEWQELSFTVSKPHRTARPLPQNVIAFDFRMQNIAGQADDFNLDVQPIYYTQRPALERLSESYLAKRQELLLKSRLDLLDKRLGLVDAEEFMYGNPEFDNTPGIPELLNAYLASFAQPLAPLPRRQNFQKAKVPTTPEVVLNPSVFKTRTAIVKNKFQLTLTLDANVKADRFHAYLLSDNPSRPIFAYSVPKEPNKAAQMDVPLTLPLWSPFIPNTFPLLLLAYDGKKIVASDCRDIGFRTAQILQSGANTLLRHVGNRNRPDWFYSYNGQPSFFRTAIYSGVENSLEQCPTETIRLMQELWVEGQRNYGMPKNTIHWRNSEQYGVGRLSSFAPSYKSLRDYGDIDGLLRKYSYDLEDIIPLSSRANSFVHQVGNEVELDSWGASINAAFPGTPFQPLDIIAQQLIDNQCDTAPIMYVRAGTFRKVEPLPHEDISGINQYTGRYSGNLDEAPRDLAELAAEATLANRPIAITEWNGPKYSWATGGIGGITTRGAAYYLEKYWRAMTNTPGIVGSAEFTLNWVIAPFEDLTNQSREEAFKNRLKHSSFGGGHTSDHVPLLNADIVVPDDCYRSMQAFHSPLYIMSRTPGDIVVSGDVSKISSTFYENLNAIGKNAVKRDFRGPLADLDKSNAHHIYIAYVTPTSPFGAHQRIAFPGIQPPPIDATEPSFQTIVNPVSPDHLLTVMVAYTYEAHERGLKLLENAALNLRDLYVKEANMPRLLVLTDKENVNVMRNYVMDKAVRGYAYTGDDVRTSLDKREFIKADNNVGKRRVAWQSLHAVLLDVKRELTADETALIEQWRSEGVNLVISRSAYESNPPLQKQFAAKLMPSGDFSQPLTTELESPIPLRMLGSANLDVVKTFYPKYVDHNGTKVFAVETQSAQGVAFDSQKRPVIVQFQSESPKNGTVTLLGYDLGDVATVHWRVTHSGKTHPIYDRDTACGLERPTLAALNAALARPSLNTNPQNRLFVKLKPSKFLMERKESIPLLEIQVTDQNGKPPANVQINARTRLRVDGAAGQSSPYYRLDTVDANGCVRVVCTPQKSIEPSPDYEMIDLPYFPNDKPYRVSKILSIQLKIFATDKDGAPFVPEDAACAFILKE